MTAIRVIFDGKAFVPDGPVSVPAHAEGFVLVDGADPVAQRQLDEAVRAYYQRDPGDLDDAEWGAAVGKESRGAWDED